jgi:hypothetical protein
MKRFASILVLMFAVTAIAQRPGPPSGPDPWAYGPQNNRWAPTWNQRPDPRRGACFYTTAPFRGNHFCVRAGDRLSALPGDFGDNISSIRIFGGARVRIFNDRNFSGGSAMVPGDIGDLRQLPFRGGHTWNNRISSIAVN